MPGWLQVGHRPLQAVVRRQGVLDAARAGARPRLRIPDSWRWPSPTSGPCGGDSTAIQHLGLDTPGGSRDRADRLTRRSCCCGASSSLQRRRAAPRGRRGGLGGKMSCRPRNAALARQCSTWWMFGLGVWPGFAEVVEAPTCRPRGRPSCGASRGRSFPAALPPGLFELARETGPRPSGSRVDVGQGAMSKAPWTLFARAGGDPAAREAHVAQEHLEVGAGQACGPRRCDRLPRV